MSDHPPPQPTSGLPRLTVRGVYKRGVALTPEEQEMLLQKLGKQLVREGYLPRTQEGAKENRAVRLEGVRVRQRATHTEPSSGPSWWGGVIIGVIWLAAMLSAAWLLANYPNVIWH